MQLVEDAAQVAFIHAEGDAIRILKSEIDPVGVAQRPPAVDALAVDVHSVAALQVFQQELRVLIGDARVVARDPGIAKDEVVLGVPADGERHGFQHNPRTIAGRISHDERRAPGQAGTRFRRRHQLLRCALLVGNSTPAAASMTSLARSAWQWGQYPPISVRATSIWNPK